MPKNDLWEKVLLTSQCAINRNSLKPYETKLEVLIEKNCRYQLRSIIGKPRTQNSDIGPNLNPFSPWEDDLEIVKVNDNHVLILNKYPVEIGHLLLITRKWAPQNGWLTINDWLSLNKIEKEINGLWFFNSSSKSGASQPHRHIQLLRRVSKDKLFPRQFWFEQILNDPFSDSSRLGKSTLVLPRRFSYDIGAADELNDLYLELCLRLCIGLPNKNIRPICPYNLLITDKWIGLIRRSKESYKGFSINALGFAGYFLVSRNSNIKWIREQKPLSILNEVVSSL